MPATSSPSDARDSKRLCLGNPRRNHRRSSPWLTQPVPVAKWEQPWLAETRTCNPPHHRNGRPRLRTLPHLMRKPKPQTVDYLDLRNAWLGVSVSSLTGLCGSAARMSVVAISRQSRDLPGKTRRVRRSKSGSTRATRRGRASDCA